MQVLLCPGMAVSVYSVWIDLHYVIIGIGVKNAFRLISSIQSQLSSSAKKRLVWYTINTNTVKTRLAATLAYRQVFLLYGINYYIIKSMLSATAIRQLFLMYQCT